MQITNKCQVCGGSLLKLADSFIKCKYCGQIYSIDGRIVSEDDIYQYATGLMQHNNIQDNKKASELFNSIPSYLDSAECAGRCISANNYIESQLELQRLSEIRNKEIAEKQRIEALKKKKKIFLCLSSIGVAVLILIICCVFIKALKNKKANAIYQEAVELYDAEKYEESREKFNSIETFKDSKTYISEIDNLLEEKEKIYQEGVGYYEDSKYTESINSLILVQNYKDSSDYIEKSTDALFDLAEKKIQEGAYEEAKEYLSGIPDSLDLGDESKKISEEIDNKIKTKDYEEAISYFESEEYEEAQKAFMDLGGFEKSSTYLDDIGQIYYDEANDLFESGDYVACVQKLGFIDEQSEWNDYNKAIQLISDSKEQYKKETEENAINVLNESGYEEMSSYLSGRVNELYSSQESQSLLDEYKPISLISLDTYADSGYIYADNEFCGVHYNMYGTGEPFKDNLGNTYNNGIYRMNVNFELEDSYLEYYVDEYSRLQGTVILNYDYRSETGDCYLKIYGDGDILYTSDSIKSGTNPYEIDIDISNVSVLKIEFDGFSFVNGSFVNPVLIK